MNFIRSTVSAMALLMAATANPNIQIISGPVSVRTTTAITSKNAKAGATWQGSIAQDVVRDGEVLVSRGTPVEGLIEEVRHKSDGPHAELALRLVYIDGQPVRADSYRTSGVVTPRKASKTVTGWTLAGALVGGVLHGGKGAAVGAATGAGIGVLRGGTEVKSDAVVPSESILTFEVKR